MYVLFTSDILVYSDQAQKCYCGSDNCRGYIGQSKQSSNSLKVVGSSARDLGSPRSPREKRGRVRVQRLMSDADSAVSYFLFLSADYL